LNDRELAELLVVVARSVELRGTIEGAGLIRQAARRLLQLDEDACEQCGKPIDRKPNGRKARFCSGRCRVAAHRNESPKVSA
jgi:hypothetical protein